MLAFASLAAAAFLPAVAVLAQSSVNSASAAVSSAAAQVPACALQCTIQTLPQTVCGSVTNLTCICGNTDFQSQVFNCYTSACSESELQAAIQYGYNTCQTLGITLDTTAIPTGATASRATGGNATSTGAGAVTGGTITGTISSVPQTSTSAATAASNAGGSSSAAPTSSSPSGGASKLFLQGASALAAAAIGLFVIVA